MNENNYDERQILNRGRAFEYGFLAAIVMMTLAYFAVDVLEISFDHMAIFQICLWIPITICFIYMIVKDAYYGIYQNGGKSIIVILNISGMITFTSNVVRLLIGDRRLLTNGKVTEEMGSLCCSVCILTICTVYWVKQYRDKKKYEEE